MEAARGRPGAKALELRAQLERSDRSLWVLTDLCGELRARLAQTKAIGDAFLAEYSRHLPASQLRIALWKALNVLTLVLHCWTKVKPQRLSSAMLMLEQHLRDMELS